jgi:lipopolysaccharide/colanic/teichoic acid biosynthesis glycosyltransferase
MAKDSVPISVKFPPPSKRKPIEAEPDFLSRISQECRRAERSKQRFVLVLVKGLERLLDIVPAIADSLAVSTREIDMAGWYETDSTMGVLFVELGATTAEAASETLISRIKEALAQAGNGAELQVSAYILPRDINEQLGLDEALSRIYPYLEPLSSPDKRTQLVIKRVIDLVGSASLLFLLSPLLLVIAIAVKLGSPGPVLFRQTRVGQGGKLFTFLKFRSMTVANDSSIHENYVKEFIQGTAAKHKDENGDEVFKLTQDSRVTSLGKFLRKSSLDELPQFWNVLLGEMSLVGPRPPIPYEVECYALWHQRRVLELKPGITGLWQIRGRSRTVFDDMVRLDLQYARTWSPWLDLKILLLTPFAVFGGGGAH